VPLGAYGESDRGLGFLQDVAEGDGTFRLLLDRSQPAGALTLDSGVSEFLVSPDLRFTYLGKRETADGPAGLLASNEGKGSCALGVGRDLYAVAFAPDAKTIYWAQDADDGFNIEGWYAPTDHCADKRPFSTNLAYLATARGGLLFAEHDPDRLTMTVRWAAMNEGGALPGDGGALVHEAIDLTVSRGGQQYLVFTVSKGEAPGLYSYGPLP
jgi:hypothetical protein